MKTTITPGTVGTITLAKNLIELEVDEEKVPTRAKHEIEYLACKESQTCTLFDTLRYVSNRCAPYFAILTEVRDYKVHVLLVRQELNTDGHTVHITDKLAEISNIDTPEQVIQVSTTATQKEYVKNVLDGAFPKKYGMTSNGELTSIGLVKWLYFAMLKRQGASESWLKAQIEGLKSGTFYLYALKTGFPEVACLIAESTGTTSCMTEHRLESAYRKFDYIVENEEGEPAWLHPFRGYEHEDNCMLVVSKEPPEKILDKTLRKNPFIARGFSYDGKCARWYGSSEVKWHIFWADVIEYATPLGMEIYAYYKNSYTNILPYVDGAEDVSEPLLNSCERLCEDDWNETPARIAAKRMAVCDKEDNDEDERGWYMTSHSTGYMDWHRQPLYHDCAICGEEYEEDEMLFAEDLQDWVRGDFARFNSVTSVYELDGLAVYRYYN